MRLNVFENRIRLRKNLLSLFMIILLKQLDLLRMCHDYLITTIIVMVTTNVQG